MPARGGETVTFLFTDIEGSTRLWQEHPATMPDTLARHDAIARRVVAERGGRVFKHTGDGVCAAFAEAPAALDAAVALQRALATAGWEDGPRPRVRMALDTGPAQERDGDYFGPTLNRIARVLAIGTGGQILATAATAALAPDVEGIDLGSHRLRDLGEPVQLRQVVAPDLERTFPPVRSLERFRHSLPIVRSSFVGREAEVARLRALVADVRLLTVTGVGGCGKTRLALAVASHELDRFADGVFFVDLSVVSDPGLVWGAIAGALRMADGGAAAGLPPRDLVLARLSDATALILLDNCEHVLDACADVAGTLIDRAPAVVVVATTREPLGVEGEQVYRVPSLTLGAADGDAAGSEAVRLFVERAATADASFVLDSTVAPVVVEICRRLDGIPLAIELAAARVRHLSVDEIARRLDDRFRLLTGGPRGARQRQQTLAAALDWSFQLLTERERTLLRRCSVFVDGFTLAAAEGICVGGGLDATAVVDVLGALVDKSLVALHAAEHRYRLLETIRLYALDRLVEAGETHAVRSRHLAWYVEAYAQPRGLFEPISPDLENLRAARTWARDTEDSLSVARLTVALFSQSHVYDPAMFEEREWSLVALDGADLPPSLRAELLAVASFRDIGAGDWSSAIEHARAAIALAAEPGAGLVGGAYFAMAIGLMVRDPDAGDRVLDEGIAQLRRVASPLYPEAFLAAAKVGSALMRGDPQGALEIGRRVRMQESLPDNFGIAYALHLLGDHRGAEADALSRPIGREPGMRNYNFHLLFALTAGAEGRWDDAARELAAAAALVRHYRYPLTLNDCVVVCGALAALEGRLERACVLLAAVADQSFVRTPEMWAVYLHYRNLVRTALDGATIKRCREDGRTTALERAFDEELARWGVVTSG